MISKDYLVNIPTPKTNTLHDSNTSNLTDISSNMYSPGEFSNLVYNSNLENSNIIK